MFKLFKNKLGALRANAALMLMAGVALAVSISAANAEDFASMAAGGTTQLGAISTFIVTGAFVVGLCSVGFSIWTFRVAHKSEGRDAKMSHGVVYFLVGAGLLALPAMTGTSVDTLFSGTSSSSTAAAVGTLNVQ